MDPIQHTVNSIYANDNKIYVGMGNYQILQFNGNFEIERRYPIGWELKKVFVTQQEIFASSLKQTVTVIEKVNGSSSELEIPYGSLGLHITEEGMIIAGAYQGLVRVWDAEKQHKFDLEGHNTRIWAICDDETHIITGDGFRGPHCTLRFWDKSDGELKEEVEFNNFRINSMIKIGEELLMTLGHPGEVIAFNIAKKKVMWRTKLGSDLTGITYHNGSIFLADNDELIELSVNGEIIHKFKLQHPILALEKFKENIVVGLRNQLMELDHNYQIITHKEISSEFSVYSYNKEQIE